MPVSVALWVGFIITLLLAAGFLFSGSIGLSVPWLIAYIVVAILLARHQTRADVDHQQLTTVSALLATILVIALGASFWFITQGLRIASLAAFMLAVAAASQYPFRPSSTTKRLRRLGIMILVLVVAWYLIAVMVFGPAALYFRSS